MTTTATTTRFMGQTVTFCGEDCAYHYQERCPGVEHVPATDVCDRCGVEADELTQMAHLPGIRSGATYRCHWFCDKCAAF